ncbi:hypothetical protein [Rickettsia endosymbiont of Orchestes rusci]|uniref:hypothetical protein n=1 Tax=Rickettsia endosymbiont of Orchestes rusci TaxID=3066250 RepID=UPI00313DF388
MDQFHFVIARRDKVPTWQSGFCHAELGSALLHGWLKTLSVLFPRRRESRKILLKSS